MTAADAEYLRRALEKIGGYPTLAREALWRQEYDKAKEYWRLWHEEVDELSKHFRAASGNVGRSNRVS
jgi:hypothetical protein